MKTAAPPLLKTQPPTSLIILMASACGMLVANLYYAQPILSLIGKSIGFQDESLGLLVTLTQIGYCAGLILVIPLADVLDNRKLTSLLTIGAVGGLVVAGVSDRPWMFLAGAALNGICSVGTQVLVPFATRLAPPEVQGRVIGRVMLGLLLGIMLARPVSSLIADLWGWRAALLLPAGALVAIGTLMHLMLPTLRPPAQHDYRTLVGSLPGLFLSQPRLRRRGLYQAVLFGVFNLFWTAAPLMLAAQFGLNQREIALFALAGAGGAVAAPIAGRIADRGLTHPATAAMIAITLISFALTWPLFALSALIPMLLAAIIMDGAVQGNQVLSQSIVYRLIPEARGRINAIYMCMMFAGGAVGSALAPWLYSIGDWPLIVGAGSAACAFILILWTLTPRDRG